MKCNQFHGKSGFYKKQWKLKGKGMCKECWDGRGLKRKEAPSETTKSGQQAKKPKQSKPLLECNFCLKNVQVSQEIFEQYQKAQEDDDKPTVKCRECIPSSFRCTGCNKEYGKSGFYTKQWNLMGKGMCKECWNKKQANPPLMVLSPMAFQANRGVGHGSWVMGHECLVFHP